MFSLNFDYDLVCLQFLREFDHPKSTEFADMAVRFAFFVARDCSRIYAFFAVAILVAQKVADVFARFRIRPRWFLREFGLPKSLEFVDVAGARRRIYAFFAVRDRNSARNGRIFARFRLRPRFFGFSANSVNQNLSDRRGPPRVFRRPRSPPDL